MQWEEYFEFVSADEIRIRGTRVGIETVLFEYLDGALPEEIAVNYPPLTLEQVHATITYFLSKRAETDEYLAKRVASGDEALCRQERTVSPVLSRLVELRRARHRYESSPLSHR